MLQLLGRVFLVVDIQRLEQALDRAELVGGIENLEQRGQAGLAVVSTEQAVAQAVESADPHARVLIGSIAPSRVSISLEALLVKVTASIPAGLAWPDWIRWAMRVVSTRVLPLPAPARIRADWCGRVAASSCSG